MYDQTASSDDRANGVAEPRSLAALLDRISEVCPVPSSAQRVIALTSDPRTNTAEVAEALACDPAIAAEVLRLANSGAYARPRRVVDLRQAASSLGLDELRNVAAAMGLLAAFRSNAELSLDLNSCGALSGSICQAIMRKLFASMTGPALVCGLLCEVGALACLSVDSAGYVELWERVRAVGPVWSAQGASARDEFETERYGATTREIGARLLRRNQLPEEIVTAIEAPDRWGRAPTALCCATAFARRAAPLLVALVEHVDATTLAGYLATLALETRVGASDGDALRLLCLDAARDAELSLRKTRQ